jgi:hypothetical protein
MRPEISPRDWASDCHWPADAAIGYTKSTDLSDWPKPGMSIARTWIRFASAGHSRFQSRLDVGKP